MYTQTLDKISKKSLSMGRWRGFSLNFYFSLYGKNEAEAES